MHDGIRADTQRERKPAKGFRPVSIAPDRHLPAAVRANLITPVNDAVNLSSGELSTLAPSDHGQIRWSHEEHFGDATIAFSALAMTRCAGPNELLLSDLLDGFLLGKS